MPFEELIKQLQHIGRRLVRWEAARRAAWWTGGWLGLLWALGLGDLVLRFEQPGRMAAAALLLATAGVALWDSGRKWRRLLPPPAVAARVERAFPALDNGLINFVLFGLRPAPSPFERVYLARGVPGWSAVRVDALRSWREDTKAALAAALAVLLLIAPWAWAGATWTNSLARVINPFSKRAPVTLARLVAVSPGHAAVEQGHPVRMECRAHGLRGQRVFLDLWPENDRSATLDLGRLEGRGEELFAYEMPRVTSDLRYRFRVGDARSERYRLEALPPLALTAARVRVKPPAYTWLTERVFDGLKELPSVPDGSTVELEIEAVLPLESAQVTDGREPAVRFEADGPVWRARLAPPVGGTLQISALDRHSRETRTEIRLQREPDRPPTVRIVAPVGVVALPAGGQPRLEWEASDDYGLARVLVERIPAEGSGASAGAVVQAWTFDSGAAAWASNWTAAMADFDFGVTNWYRVVAEDTREPGPPNISRSAAVGFVTAASDERAAAQRAQAADAASSLARLIEMQRRNLADTKGLQAAIEKSRPDQWTKAADVQEQIRRMGGELLQGRQALGALAGLLRALHEGAMADVVQVLRRAAEADVGERTSLGGRAIALQESILRQLTYAGEAAERVQQHAEVSGLLAMLDALIAGQHAVWKETRALPDGAEPPKALPQRQDRLSEDTTLFVRAARKEAEANRANDPPFAQAAELAATLCETGRVAAVMTAAAEEIEKRASRQAAPLQEQALNGLRAAQGILNAWRAAQAEKEAADMLETFREVKDRFAKMIELQSDVVEAIRNALEQKDRSDKETDELEEEIAQLKLGLQDALLQVATDLQVFPEAPIGNDLVQDCYQVYEEMKQIEGSEEGAITELGLQKEDEILELLRTPAKRLDDSEMWLAPAPDAVKRNMEAFDIEEIPNITVVPLLTEMEDVISDLLKQNEEQKEQADDSASNQGSADLPAGWGTMEGEWNNYSAKGKSGNEAPEHKEQDGRSNIGRQGMANGETVAGSGKINEGDPNIERRRTQDGSQSGQVQEEDHSKAVATGGGKQSGYGDDKGMSGTTGPRRDAMGGQGSVETLEAMLRRDTEAVYGKASLMRVQTGALDEAVRNLRLAEEAAAKGLPISQVREFQRRAAAALVQTRSQWTGAYLTDWSGGAGRTDLGDEQTASAAEEAPPEYRELVSKYFKALSEEAP